MNRRPSLPEWFAAVDTSDAGPRLFAAGRRHVRRYR